MQSFDIKNRVKVFLYSEFKKLDKFEILGEDSGIVQFLDESNSPEMIKKTMEGESFIALIEDDVVFDNLITDDFFSNIQNELSPGENLVQAIWFSGAVEIKGTMYTEEKADYSTALIFEKPVKAKNVITGGTTLSFLDKVEVSTVFYNQIQSEGWMEFNGMENSFHIEATRQVWTKDGIEYDFSEFSEDLIAEKLDEIFINKDDFFEVDEDESNEEVTLYFDMELVDKMI